MDAEIISMRGLTLTAEAGRVLLRNFSMSVQRGEKVVITGPSGCGKSTLLKCLIGVAVPAAGTVAVAGEELNSRNIWRLRDHFAWVGQEPFPGHGTVRRRLEEVFSYRGNQRYTDWRTRLPELMNDWHLGEELLKRDLSLLSGGEKQRFGLVLALLLARPVMLLDEPSSALDPANREHLGRMIRDSERTVVYVAHDAETAAAADRKIELAGIVAEEVRV